MPWGIHVQNLKSPYDFLGRAENGGYFFYFAALHPICQCGHLGVHKPRCCGVSKWLSAGGGIVGLGRTKCSSKRLCCSKIGGGEPPVAILVILDKHGVHNYIELVCCLADI